MAKIFAGRYSAQIEGPFVVFLIGMRVNRLWAVHKWLPTALAMGPMLRALYQHPELGFLGAQTYFSSRTILTVQYWRSFADLEQFARAADEPHLAPWKRFNRAIGTDGSVGIFHETYQVAADQYEVVYGNMPRVGLAAVAQHVPATGKRETARRRLGGESEPGVPSPLPR